MKNRIKILAAALVLIIIIFLGFKISNKINIRKVISEKIEKLPQFSFLKQNGKPFSNSNLKDNSGTIIFNYFSPDCEHCQDMAKEIRNNIHTLSDATIIMVTTADSIAVNNFISKYKIGGIKNITVIRDSKYEFNNSFGPAVVPSFFIYKNKNLIKKISGETKIENLY